jgi:hypothetical protein
MMVPPLHQESRTLLLIDGGVVRGAKNVARHCDFRHDGPHLQNTCLSNPVGASAVFYDTFVNLEKISERELVA